MKRAWKFTRGLLVILATVALTTLAINATDNMGNFSDSLIGAAIGLDEPALCPVGMVHIPNADGGFCIDQFENAASEDCTYKDPQTQEESRANLESPDCMSVSQAGLTPWRYIARHQAELACRKAGKRLPSNREWYQAVLGTPDTRASVQRNDCNVSSGQIAETGSYARCVASSGARDMIGNAWEWVEETIQDGALGGTELPEEGYVTSIDSNGMPIATNFDRPDPNFNDDYMWIDKDGVRGMIRGGYFGNGTDAGQYTLNAITPPSFAGVGVGFRCVK